MRRTPLSVFGPLGRVLTLFVLLFVAAGCEDEGTPDGGFAFDASFGTIDATTPPVPDAEAPLPETTLTSTPSALSNEANAKFEFTSTEPGLFACRLDDAAPTECASPHIVPVSEGVHTFSVAAVTAAGVDLTPASFTWTVDQTPPKTTITKAPPAADNSVRVTFEWSATEDSVFTCAVDDGAGLACASPFDVTDLTDGSHTLKITAKDHAGNEETPPASHTWTVDTSTPDTVINSGPTGTVSAKTATFTFSSPKAGAGTTFACALDSATFAACTSPITTAALSEGPHTFRVRAADAANNQDITPAVRAWTVDSVPPTVTITGGPAGPTNDATPSFTFTTGGATSTQCRVDADAFVACTSPFTSAALGEGPHSVTVRAFDAAKNSADAARRFTVDTRAPSVTITTGPAGPTNDKTPAFTFTTSGGASGTMCRIDAAAFAPCTSPFTSAALADAPHTFEVQAKDAAGNVATATRAFSVDTAPPTVTIIGGPTGPTNDSTPTFTFTTVGATSTACRIVPQAFAPCATPFTPPPPALLDGPYTFEVRATDAAQNSATAARAFSVDTALPSIVINRGPTGPTNDATPTFAFTAGNGAVATTCRFDAETFATCASPFTRVVALGQGAHTFEVRATDAATNFATASRGFTVDTMAPAVTILAGPLDPTPTADPTPTFDFTVTGATSVDCRIDTAPFTTCSASYTPVTTLGDGAHTFTIRAADAATNVTTVNRAFTVDTTPPVITFTSGPNGPTNDSTPTFTWSVTGNPTTIECRLDAAIFSACTSPTTISTRMTQGTHTFQVRAADALDNTSTASRTFILDTIRPTVDIYAGPQGSPMSEEIFSFTKETGAYSECRLLVSTDQGVTYTPYSSFSACPGPNVTVQMPPPGTYRLEVRVRDAAGNAQSDFWDFYTYVVF